MERHVYASRYVHREFADVCRLLEQAPDRVLEPASEVATTRANEVMSSLRVDLGGFTIGRAVEIELGPFERDGDHVARLPIRWRPAGGSPVFPVMEADLEITPQAHGGRPLTQLAFLGHYRPPLWVLGSAADAMAGRRVAELVVQHFVEEVAVRIERALSPSGVGRYVGQTRKGVA